jgi:hypothetical protein
MIKTRKFATLEELNIHLQGGFIGDKDLVNLDIFDIDGKTLVFTTPSATVTFDTDPEGAGVPLSVQDIISQIDTQTTNVVKPRVFKGRLVIIEGTPSNGVVPESGTAMERIGLKPVHRETQTDFVFNDDDGNGDSTITTTAGDFVGAGLKAGHYVTIINGANDGNTGYIRSVTTTVVTMIGVVFSDETLGTSQTVTTLGTTGKIYKSDGLTDPYIIEVGQTDDGYFLLVSEEA